MAIGIMMERLRQRFASGRLPMAVLAVIVFALLAALCSGYVHEMRAILPPGKFPVFLDEARRLGLAVLGVAFCFALGALLSRTRVAGVRWVQALSRDSMGIYLYSDPLNYALLTLFVAGFGILGLGVPQLSMLLVAMRFVVTLTAGWAVTLLLRRLSHAL